MADLGGRGGGVAVRPPLPLRSGPPLAVAPPGRRVATSTTTTTPTTTTPTTTTPTSTTATATTTTTAVQPGGPADPLDGALLGAAQVGPGWTLVSAAGPPAAGEQPLGGPDPLVPGCLPREVTSSATAVVEEVLGSPGLTRNLTEVVAEATPAVARRSAMTLRREMDRCVSDRATPGVLRSVGLGAGLDAWEEVERNNGNPLSLLLVVAERRGALVALAWSGSGLPALQADASVAMTALSDLPPSA